jgi:hypothetical protein
MPLTRRVGIRSELADPTLRADADRPVLDAIMRRAIICFVPLISADLARRMAIIPSPFVMAAVMLPVLTGCHGEHLDLTASAARNKPGGRG